MTDHTERAVEEHGTVDVPSATPHDDIWPNEAVGLPDLRDYEQIRDVVARYTGQLLYGCGSCDCTEALCDSGYRNATPRPVRRYTPRSARALAVVLASGPKPRARLCSRYRHLSQHDHPPPSEGPRDPSAFVQQLADTARIRDLAKAPDVALRGDASYKTGDFLPMEKALDYDFGFWHSLLTSIPTLFPLEHDGTIDGILASSCRQMEPVINTLKWIISRLPQCTTAQWNRVNEIISAGHVYPTRKQFITGPSSRAILAALDALEDRQNLRLFCRCLRILHAREVADRTALDASIASEGEVCHKQRYTVGSDCLTAADHVLSAAMDEGADWQAYLIISVLLKKVFLRSWSNEVRVSVGTLANISLRILERIFMEAWNEPYFHRNCKLPEVFGMAIVVRRLDAVELAQSWITGPREGHLLGFSFLFQVDHDATYLRTINHLRMRGTNSDAEVASALRSRFVEVPSTQTAARDQLSFLEEHYLLLDVSRDNVLKDTFDQMWQRRERELLRPLRVRLGEMHGFEIGHDLGGVQIEFFNLVWKAFLSEEAQMFTTDPTTGHSYFTPGSLQPLYMFELCGLLFALAIHNGINIPVDFPIGFYHNLQGFLELSLLPIRESHPVIARAMKTILEDDVPDLQSTFTLEANGLRLTVPANVPPERLASSRYALNVIDVTPVRHHIEHSRANGNAGALEEPTPAGSQHNLVDLDSIADAWPGWHLQQWFYEPEEVTDDNKNEYVAQYVHWLLVLSVMPQWDAFRSGFARIYNDLDSIGRHHIKTVIEGTRSLDIKQLQRVTTYEGYDPDCRYIRCFWRIVSSWTETKQLLLVKFVTARERIPPEGATGLKFQINRASHMSLDHLPTSSTCFGTLTLPLYPNTRILEEKLNLALEFGAEGFGSG